MEKKDYTDFVHRRSGILFGQLTPEGQKWITDAADAINDQQRELARLLSAHAARAEPQEGMVMVKERAAWKLEPETFEPAAPDATPETDAAINAEPLLDDSDTANLPALRRFINFARTLERQRNALRGKLAAMVDGARELPAAVRGQHLHEAMLAATDAMRERGKV